MPKTKKYIPKGKLGTGKRFKQLTKNLAKRRGKKKATNPKALAAYIGRKTYGKKKFQEMATAGKKRAAAKRKRASVKRRKA